MGESSTQVQILNCSSNLEIDELRTRVRSGKADDAELKAFVVSSKAHGVFGTEVQKTKTELVRRSARADLFAALKGNSYRSIQKKLKRAQHWLSKREVDDAQDVIKHLQVGRELEEVRNSKDARAMRKVCNKADLMKQHEQRGGHEVATRALDTESILKMAAQLDGFQQLSEAKAEDHFEHIIEAYESLQNIGVRRLEVTSACELTRLTKDGEDVQSLRRVCTHSRKVGVALQLISDAEQLLQRREVDRALIEKLDSEDAEVLEAARAHAEISGASAELVAAAQRKVNHLRLRSQSPTDVPRRMEATLQIGRTPVHENLGPLLAMVMAARADVFDSCDQFEQRFAHKHSRFFSLDGQKIYGQRGGKPYFKPKGWARYGLRVPDFDETKDWCVAYHGTVARTALSIVKKGLCKPGEEGVAVLHGQRNGTGQTIYTSPSLEYAAHPVYAQFFELKENHWAQLVFQLRVRPGHYAEQYGTLGNKYWPQDVQFDPNFESMKGLEWLLEDSSHMRVTGFLVREFGPGIDAASYGPLNSQVRDEGCSCPRERRISEGCRCGRGPEYVWTRIRAEHFRQQGLLTK